MRSFGWRVVIVVVAFVLGFPAVGWAADVPLGTMTFRF